MSSMSSSLNPELQPTLPASIPRPFWKIRDPDKITGSESEAIRMAYAADEAHLKSLGWLNFVLALGFTFMTVHFMMLAVQVAKGTILAPWMNMTPWVVVIRLQPILTILAAITGFGLYTKRSWSPKAELAFALAFAAFGGLLLSRDMWTGHVTDANSFLRGHALLVAAHDDPAPPRLFGRFVRRIQASRERPPPTSASGQSCPARSRSSSRP